MALSLTAVWFLIGETHRGQQLTPALTPSVAKSTVSYCATSRLDSTIIAPVSVYHLASYAERYSRYRGRSGIILLLTQVFHQPRNPMESAVFTFGGSLGFA